MKRLTGDRIKDAERLKEIYLAKRHELKLTQKNIGEKLDISQGAVGHYLNGRNGLSLESLHFFSVMLQCSPMDISPALGVHLAISWIAENE